MSLHLESQIYEVNLQHEICVEELGDKNPVAADFYTAFSNFQHI